jgi:NAD(P)-dependent dehydrogenase (short-subunit alcohol dehydrogenase family)
MISGLFETVLDRSVVFSFDRSGFLRHEKRFESADVAVDLGGRVALITGANAGIGLETARGLLERGASVHMLCRSLDRAEAARERLQSETGKQPSLWRLDVSNLSDIRDFVGRFTGDVDILVHNAGVLPNERTLTPDGLELTWATHVVGPVLLTECLLERLSRSGDGRVITVSSGGMLLHKLGLSDIGWEKRSQFDGVNAYANAKRAQVILTEQWAERHPRITFSSMHPGWVDTRSLQASLPRFRRLMSAILRTPEQGADTVVWLAACPHLGGISGKFWFDRQAVPTHVLMRTKESVEDRECLWGMCHAQARLE